MRKEWVCELRFLWFLQFLQLPPGWGSESLPGWGCSTPGLLWGQSSKSRAGICRKDRRGRAPPPRYKRGSELFVEVHSDERYFEFSPQEKD